MHTSQQSWSCLVGEGYPMSFPRGRGIGDPSSVWGLGYPQMNLGQKTGVPPVD